MSTDPTTNKPSTSYFIRSFIQMLKNLLFSVPASVRLVFPFSFFISFQNCEITAKRREIAGTTLMFATGKCVNVLKATESTIRTQLVWEVRLLQLFSTSLASSVCGTSGKLKGLIHPKTTTQTVIRLVTTAEAAEQQSCEQCRGLIRRRALSEKEDCVHGGRSEKCLKNIDQKQIQIRRGVEIEFQNLQRREFLGEIDISDYSVNSEAEIAESEWKSLRVKSLSVRKFSFCFRFISIL